VCSIISTSVGDPIRPGVPGKCLVVWIVKRCFVVTCRIQFGMPGFEGWGVNIYSRLSYGISTELSTGTFLLLLSFCGIKVTCFVLPEELS